MRPKYLARDLGQRLADGIVFYKEEPHLVTRIHDDGLQISLIPLNDLTSKGFKVEISSNDLDVSSRSLGYCNFNSRAYYLTRTPSRRYKQSLMPSMLEIFSPDGGANVNNLTRGGNGRLQNDILIGASGYAMLMNKYPTISTALESLKSGKATSVAVDKNVAITRNDFGIYHVWYKTQNVAYLDSEKRLRVPNDDLSFIVTNHLKIFETELNRT